MIGAKGSIVRGAVNDMFMDDSTDLSDLEQFGREHDFSMGLSCYCIGTGDLYMMKSDFTWKKQ